MEVAPLRLLSIKRIEVNRASGRVLIDAAYRALKKNHLPANPFGATFAFNLRQKDAGWEDADGCASRLGRNPGTRNH
jgi:hypothetical protein